MRNLKKLIVITAITALLFCVLMSCALADEKLYTSEVFKLPKELLIQAIESQKEPEAELPENPEEVEAPEGEGIPGEDLEPEETEESGEQEPEEIPGEQEPEEIPGEQEPEEIPGEGEPAEVPDEQEPDELPGEPEAEEPVKAAKKVVITSNQAAIVTEGDLITLRSELIGFEDVSNITYQWQADKGNGAGWEDMNGGNEADYTFVANRDSIQWSWRLIVNYDD